MWPGAAEELFAFYERGGRHLEADIRERELPAMQEWEACLRDTVLASSERRFAARESPSARWRP